MKEFKIGGKIILEDNVSYRILDIIKYKGNDFLFCCTDIKPITPKILHYKKENKEVFVKEEKNPLILLEISKILVKNKI